MSSFTGSLRAQSQDSGATLLKPVSPSNVLPLPDGRTRGLHVAGAGDVAVVDMHGNTVTLRSGAGQYHPVQIVQIMETGTTASGIVALY